MAAACLGKLGGYVEKKDPVCDRLVELLDDPDLRDRLFISAIPW